MTGPSAPFFDPSHSSAPGNQSRPLAELNAVVTGASSGIGRAVAMAFARAGCRRIVIQYCTNRSAAEQTLRDLRSLGTDAHALACDFSDANQTASFTENAFRVLPRLDVLFHAAGADVLTGQSADWSFDEKLRRLIEVDLGGSIRLGRLFAQRLRAQALAKDASDQVPVGPLPSMIFVSWDQANEGMEGDAGQMFAPIKAGVEAFAKSLAQDLAASARVNVVAPGWIRTAWGESTQGYWDQRARGQSLMCRWGTADDVAAAGVFLASPASAFVSGQTINVNGGWNRRFERHSER